MGDRSGSKVGKRCDGLHVPTQATLILALVLCAAVVGFDVQRAVATGVADAHAVAITGGIAAGAPANGDALAAPAQAFTIDAVGAGGEAASTERSDGTGQAAQCNFTYGTPTRFTVSATNTGNIAFAATDTVALAPQLSTVAGSCTVDSGTCTIVNAQTVRWTGTLQGGQTAHFSFLVQVDDSTPPGTQLCSTATLEGGDPTPPSQACGTTCDRPVAPTPTPQSCIQDNDPLRGCFAGAECCSGYCDTSCNCCCSPSDTSAVCGGSCSRKCTEGQQCNGTDDCQSGLTCDGGTCSAPSTQCHVYYSSDVPKDIPDLGTAISTVNVPSGTAIGSVKVKTLQGTHSFVQDLEFHLISPVGTDVTVIEHGHCGLEHDFNLGLDDASTADLCPMNDGLVHHPSNPLATFDGQNPVGTWTLQVNDVDQLDSGQLQQWAIEICPQSTPEPPGCVTRYSTDVPQHIPDLGTAISTLDIPAGKPITSVKVVTLQGTHSFVQDLEFHLISPTGTDVTVIEHGHCGLAHDFNLGLDDASAADLCPMNDGQVHHPSNPLGTFDGESPGGTWTLKINDVDPQDDGNLQAWGIQVCSTPPPGCETYDSTDVPKVIPDLGTASSTITVPAGVPIGQVILPSLQGTHSFVQDLEFHLISPAGTDVTVIEHGHCGLEHDFNLGLDDASAADLCPMNDGQVHHPSNPLAAFDGENSAGTWTLKINDVDQLDSGQLDHWQLEICGPSITPTPTPKPCSYGGGFEHQLGSSTGNEFSATIVLPPGLVFAPAPNGCIAHTGTCIILDNTASYSTTLAPNETGGYEVYYVVEPGVPAGTQLCPTVTEVINGHEDTFQPDCVIACPPLTPTHGPTDTPTVTPTPTKSYTPTRIPTPTVTRTPPNTPTGTLHPTATPTRTATPTVTQTGTPTRRPKLTFTPTPTEAATPTPTQTRVPTPTPTSGGPTVTPPPATPSPTSRFTATRTPTGAPPATGTATRRPKLTFTPTPTEAATATPTRTSGTPAPTPTGGGPTGTPRPTNTATPTGQPKFTFTPTKTATPTPTGAAGQPCSSGSQCQSGNCVDGRCCGTASCPSGEFCNIPGREGTCAGPNGNGAPCDTGQQCASGNCVDGTCCASASCPSGQFCTSGECQPPADNGIPCGAAPQCRSGFCLDGFCCASSSCPTGQVCATGQCTGVGANGAPCSDPSQCRSGFCVDGFCCGSRQCPDGQFCNTGTCGGPAVNGSPCGVPEQCASNFCVDRTCCSTSTCPTGQLCNIPNQAGSCAGPAGLGNPCVDPVQCQSTHCTDGACCGVAACPSGQSCNVAGQAGQCAPIPPDTCGACVGDCNCDHEVIITELVVMVNVALNGSSAAACRAGDPNGDDAITINEIIAAVVNALNGCPASGPTPTPTPTPGATPGAGTISQRAAGTTIGLAHALPAIPAVLSSIAQLAQGGSALIYDDGGAAAVKNCSVSGTRDLQCTQSPPGIGPRNYTLTFSNCVLNAASGGTVAVNGTLTGQSTDTGLLALCSLPPTALSTFSINNVSVEVKNGAGATTLSAQFNLTGSLTVQPDFLGSCKISGLSMMLSGTATVHSGALTETLTFDNTDLRLTVGQFSQSCVPVKYDMTLNGPATIDVDPLGASVSGTFTNFVFSDDTTSGSDMVTMTGQLASPCFGTTLTFATPTQIVLPSTATCPTGGAELVTAAGTTDRINYTSGGGVELDLGNNNSVDATFSSCLDPALYVCPAG